MIADCFVGNVQYICILNFHFSKQKIYETARKKLADALVLGLTLKIEGGDYRLCNGTDTTCPKHNCNHKLIAEKFKMKKGEKSDTVI